MMTQRNAGLRSWTLGIAVITVLAILAGCAAPAAPAAESGDSGAADASSEAVTIDVWAIANNVEHWRADGPAQAAEEVTDFDVTVNPTNDTADWGEYKQKYTLAADAGEAPEIVVSGHEDVPIWANAGYIIEFEECRQSHPEFENVIDSLWESVTWQGKIWGVPQDTEARPMFYNKEKLAELGWSQEEIDSLPQRIIDGEFTLDDLLATANEAVQSGVVDEGNAYWHRPSKGFDFLQYYVAYGGRVYDEAEDMLVISREPLQQWYAFQRQVVEDGLTPENFIGTDWSIWHSTVTSGDVLFWNGGIWQWSDWATNYVSDQGGQDYLFDFVGYALQPSGIEGEAGTTLSHPLVYMISSPNAAGSQNQAAACAVLAKTTTAEINTLHAVESTHLGVVDTQADYEAYASDRLLSETLYMLDYNFYQPNHIMYGPYYDIIYDFMVRAENGELSPVDAADQAVAQLEAELADYVMVEE